MDLTECSREELIRVVQNLIEEGTINEGDLKLPIGQNERNAATLLHAIICNRPHGDTECTFYNNDREIETWVKKVRKFCFIYECTPDDILIYISKIKEFGVDAEPYLVILSLFCVHHESIWEAVQVIDSI